MAKRKTFKIPLVLIGLAFLFFAYTFTSSPVQITGRISFLREGEVWAADPGGQNLRQLTNDSGKVDEFLFSPGLRYLAYAKVIGSAEEPGLWDSTEPPPQRAIHSIVILDLQANKKVSEIRPNRDPWIYIDRWLPGEKFLYHAADGFSVSGYYQYDPLTVSETELHYGDSELLEADYSSDGLLKAYVDYSGLGNSFRNNLHLLHRQSNKDTILFSRKGTICNQRISYGGSDIAFIEVEVVGKNYFDILWHYDLRTSTFHSLYRGPAKAKSGGTNYIAWSFNDRHVGMFFSPAALVFGLQHPENCITITGRNFCWIGNDRIAFNLNDDLYVYDLTMNSRVLLLKKAEQPVFLH